MWLCYQWLSVSAPFRVKGVTADQEADLLQQLTEITRVMQEGHLVEEAAPEQKSWEGSQTPGRSISSAGLTPTDSFHLC